MLEQVSAGVPTDVKKYLDVADPDHPRLDSDSMSIRLLYHLCHLGLCSIVPRL